MTGMDEERVLRLLPLGLLALATVVATVAAPGMGDAAADVRVTLALSAVTAAWVLLTPAPGVVNYAGRTALAFALCWLNPFYAIFAWIGYIDAFSVLRGAWVHVAVAVVAVTQAGAQAGGFPPQGVVQVVVFVALVALNVGLVTVFMRLAEQTERRNLELERLNADLQRLLDENASLHAQLLVQAREAGVQEERRRLAREIHDTIAQGLAGIVTQLEAAVGGERQERALRLARQALGEARRSVLALAPRDLDGATLPDALGSVVDVWAAERAVRADVAVVGDPVTLHPEVEATVLRIAQESLTNVAKHAGASRVGVTLSYDDGEVVLDVRDDGVGFDLAAPTTASSFGLRGMQQRAERLAGRLTLESRPGGGTAVSVRLPKLAREAA
ncbi:sensor histidine kinase [Blastococcus sp. SYSU D00669]